ncbi:repetin-like isoform X2 [Bufo bufo]|uniref:repetin-like isoform X2 n=1 Tax=Bufo bufo TaxID=8384 RepID=UPI001ABE2194|nr:repetin-like isoform X2 [Bufo bufo]
MRGLLVLGCVALGVFLVTASPQDQAQPEVEAKDEGAQGEFVHIREIRSTGDNKKRGKPLRRNSGLYSALIKLPTTRDKRNTQQQRKKCPGCFSPVFNLKLKDVKVLAPVSRQQRDLDEHEKLTRKHKHHKEKSHTRRRKHKNHEDRHAHFQAEDAEIGHNQKRHKHHRGKEDREQHRGGKDREQHRGGKDREQHRSGLFSALSRESINMDSNGRQRGHRRGKDRSQHRRGSLTTIGSAPPEME